MAQIVWTLEAERWLSDIYDYIAGDNPVAAMETVQGIYDRAQMLADFPKSGSRYWASSRHVRILLYGHYRITYLVIDCLLNNAIMVAPVATEHWHGTTHRICGTDRSAPTPGAAIAG
jgi:plasmid stabilization system protein ParE